MKITQFDDTYTQKVGAGETTLVSGSSGGSNSAFGGDVTGSAGSLSVVGLRQRVSLSSNMGDNTVGTVLTTIQSSPWLAAFAVSSNSGGGSFGSNSNDVGNASTGGASPLETRADHVHKGVHSLSKSGSSALFGDVTLTGGTNVTLTQSGQDISIASSGGGGSTGDYDPITDILGAPDTTFEFSTSSFTGLTALGSATTEDANTTIPGCYYVKLAASATYNWVGRYATPPAAPWTAVTKLVDNSAWSNFNSAGLFVGTSTPGNMDIISQGQQYRSYWLERATPTAFGSTIQSAPVTAPATATHAPIYFAIRVNSSSSVDYLFSWNGRVWRPFQLARNPSITIGSVGIVAKVENATYPESAAWDYLRIWNSAKTFPGV